MASEQNRFLQQQQQQQQQPVPSRRKRWGGCLSGLSCFGLQKGGKRVVPASRMPETHALTANQQNGAQAAVGLTNHQNNALVAPPSSPASFSNSALQSTAQSPNCFLSANSPGGPSSTMFATGPYAHETQLVSPPVFSTFTTEPSTAPLTPPPELAHLTTPSSPDVPYAHFLSSKGMGGMPYSLYPGSPARSRDTPSTPSQDQKLPQDANFFCPETFAQFYLDQSSFPHSGGRLSVSKESDVVYPSAGNANGNGNGRPSKACKQDMEELEAYRASFGFSADEIVSTPHYVEISDVNVMDDSFSMMPSSASPKTVPTLAESQPKNSRVEATHASKAIKDVEHCLTDDEEIFSKMGGSKYHTGRGQSSSDAEVEYRRGRSLRESRGNSKWP